VQTGDRHFRAASGDANLLSAIKEIAERHKATMAQVALAWIVAKGAVPIPGTTKPERVAELAYAAELALSDEEVARLDKASEKYLTLWGKEYSNLSSIRYVPCALQYLGIKALGGV
jgi:Aldo/keto reductases, related to diketogulonate reductase